MLSQLLFGIYTDEIPKALRDKLLIQLGTILKSMLKRISDSKPFILFIELIEINADLEKVMSQKF